MKFKELVINNKKDLIFGMAAKSVESRRGLHIGGGLVYPELNFTLPPMDISEINLNRIVGQYQKIVEDSLKRAMQLDVSGVMLEFETLLEMTRNPDIAVQIIAVMNDVCEKFYHQHGIISEIRLTPNDLREFERPPKQSSSSLLDPMMELFERGSLAGGDFLSIESTGGKEISDDAIMMCDIKQFIFAMAVLGVRDMKMLWKKIVHIAEKAGKTPGGDTACGFGNTAMVMADRGYIPKIFAAVARIVTVVRTLVAIEEGAKGPDKDCGYEGPYLKAITGTPISMEGKTAACAHLSPVGNVAAACADLWSNESVQNIKLLGGMAPTVYMEQLIYDTRLMNQAIHEGDQAVQMLQKLFTDSDVCLDPQAFVLAPEHVIEISKAIVKGENYVDAAVRGALKGLELIEEAMKDGLLKIADKEKSWISKLRTAIQSVPLDESQFTEQMIEEIENNKFIPEEYGL